MTPVERKLLHSIISSYSAAAALQSFTIRDVGPKFFAVAVLQISNSGEIANCYGSSSSGLTSRRDAAGKVQQTAQSVRLQLEQNIPNGKHLPQKPT